MSCLMGVYIWVPSSLLPADTEITSTSDRFLFLLALFYISRKHQSLAGCSQISYFSPRMTKMIMMKPKFSNSLKLFFLLLLFSIVASSTFCFPSKKHDRTTFSSQGSTHDENSDASSHGSTKEAAKENSQTSSKGDDPVPAATGHYLGKKPSDAWLSSNTCQSSVLFFSLKNSTFLPLE